MEEQMELILPELDRKKTQQAVEDWLERYRIYKYVTFEEREATITQSYTVQESQRTNVTSDQTANIAIHNVDTPARMRAFCEKIEKAVKRLHPKERLLIEERYMRDDYVFDFVVYNQKFNPPISKDTYGRIRWKAFYKLALHLNIAVEKE